MSVHGPGDNYTPSLLLYAIISLSVLQTCTISIDLIYPLLTSNPWRYGSSPFSKPSDTCCLQSFYNPRFPYQHCQLHCSHHVIWKAADYEDLSHPCLRLSLSLLIPPSLSVLYRAFTCSAIRVCHKAKWGCEITWQEKQMGGKNMQKERK